MSDSGPERPAVAIFGTFDVENYGDLLFPLVARQALARDDIKVVAVSPTSTTTRFADAVVPVSVNAFARSNEPCAGILIGGGNIIHLRDLAVEAYRDVPQHVAYPALWIGATLIGSAKGCPIVWNAPGVLTLDAKSAPHALVAATLGNAALLSVRDEASAALLQPFAAAAVRVVPDTALCLPTVWSKATLQGHFATLLRRHGVDVPSSVLAVHVKARSLGGLSAAEFAAEVDRVAGALELVPVLIAIGPIHGDGELTTQISEVMSSRHVALQAPESLIDVASVIASSRACITASLHGFVTATAYGVPAALVAVPPIPKFAGFAAQVGREGDVVADWPAAFAHVEALRSAGWPAPPAHTQALERIGEHFDNVRRIVANAAQTKGSAGQSPPRHVAAALAHTACAQGEVTRLLSAALTGR